jgi:hypothetical protein
MAAHDVPRPHIVLIFVEASEGVPTGQVRVVAPGRPDRVEWHDPAEIRSAAVSRRD